MGALRSFHSNMEVMITMKKLFKKSIACLIAVLMVVSTMPFTAITAQAATTDEIKTYVNANYANIGTPSGYSSTYGVRPTNWPNYTDSGTNYYDDEHMSQVYHNILWGKTDYNQDEFGQGTSNNDANCIGTWLNYTTVVMMYDGEITPTSSILTQIEGRSGYTRYLNGLAMTNDKSALVNSTWKAGNTGTLNKDFNWNYFENPDSTVGISTNDALQICNYSALVWNQWGSKRRLTNVYKYTGTPSDTTYQDSFNPTIQVYCSNNSSYGSAGKKSDRTLTGSTSIRVVNYEPIKVRAEKIKNAINEILNGGKPDGYYTQESVDAAYNAANLMLNADPTKFDYSSDQATAVNSAANAIKAAAEASDAFTGLVHEHSFTGGYLNNGDGTHSQKCAYYDNCKGVSDSKDAHSFTNYVSNNNATCTTDGTKTATCDSGCGATDTITDADSKLGHSFTNYVSNNDATCTADGTKTAKCDRCDVTDTITDVGSKLGHDYKYAQLDADNHTVTCSRCDYSENKAHNFDENNTCTDCGYVKVTIDTTAYDNAVAEYEAIIGAGDYAEKYTKASRTAYQEAVEAAKKESFATKEQVDAAVAAILSAKTKLVYAQPEIKFVEVDANGNETVIETKNYTYGTPVEFTKNADNIAKWIVKTQNGNVETKVATSQTTYTMIATEPATVYVHLTEEKTEAVQYSKVSFISKNGAVSFVKYVPAGTTLYTNTVDGVEIPFYEFKNWNKASVTADGSDIEVKAVYEFIGTEENKCRVHYDGFVGGEKEYIYDSFVYLFGAEDKTLALSTDGTVENIITYLNENAFYAPHTADIYVIEVNSPQPASIGITGSYASSTDTKKTAAFNCKFFLPAGCTVVEYGLTATSSTGKSMKIKAETASARGEYCVKVSMAKTSTVTSVEGVAYLTYRTAEGTLETIYSTPVTQNL